MGLKRDTYPYVQDIKVKMGNSKFFNKNQDVFELKDKKFLTFKDKAMFDKPKEADENSGGDWGNGGGKPW